MSAVKITRQMVRKTLATPSRDEVHNCFDASGFMLNKIRLIKFLRDYVPLGLKEAKDTIESVPDTLLEVKKLLAPIFEAYNLSIFTPEEIEANPSLASDFLQDTTVIATAILKGIATALENWRQMGFRNPFEACRIVLDNLERNPPNNTPENLGIHP